MNAKNCFMMNGVLWRIKFVSPGSRILTDPFGEPRLATTDPISQTIYLSRSLDPQTQEVVFLHELGHCVLFSYGLISEIREAVRPELWSEAEEWICNFIADYGQEIFQVADDIMFVPQELDRLLA